MDTQLDSIDISKLRAFALALNHEEVSNLMHLMPVLTAAMHLH